MTLPPLAEQYLGALDAQAAVLPSGRRHELVAEIRAHLVDALGAGAAAGGESRSEAAVRDVLERLGDPATIVRAEVGDPLVPQPPSPSGWGSRAATVVRRIPRHERAALLMLTLGSCVLVVGWLVGVVLLWTSRRWTWREKLLATLVVPLGPGPLFGGTAIALGVTDPLWMVNSVSIPALGSSSCITRMDYTGAVLSEVCTHTGPPVWILPALVWAWVLAPIVVAAVLARRADGRDRLRRKASATRGAALVSAGGVL